MSVSQPRENLTYEAFGTAVRELAQTIADDGYEPDIVLSIARGGVFVAGGLAYAVQNRRSRIAYLYGVMLDPSVRGRGLAERAVRLLAEHLIHDLGYHRVQLEVYAFNDRALRLFERAGFVREGAKRSAYWRHGAWHDGVMFGLVEDDLPR